MPILKRSVVYLKPACGSLVATMLQTSQIENPRCSAKIDQMRLRRATALPVVFQKVSSSGRQSKIQVFRLLIGLFLAVGCGTASVHPAQAAAGVHATRSRSDRPTQRGEPLPRHAL